MDHPQLEDLLEELLRDVLVKRSDGPTRPAGRLAIRCEEMHEIQRRRYRVQVGSLIDLWRRLKVFIEGVKKWSNAVEVVENCGSVVLKIEAKADELAKLLTTPSQNKISSEKTQLDSFIDELQARPRDFDNLKPEIAPVVESILGSFSSLKIHSPLDDLSLWIRFAQSTANRISDLTLSIPHMNQLASFIGRVHQGLFQSVLLLISGNEKVVIEGFFAHVGPVVLRAACLCCFFWDWSFHLPAPLTKLVEEIYFGNIKFLDITLKFLKAINKIRYCSSRTTVSQADLAGFFLSSSCKSESFFRKELTEMVIYLIDSHEEPIDEEDKCDLAEIIQVTVEAIRALRLDRRDHESALTVGRRIWLRKVGFFLKEQLLSSEKNFKHHVEDQIHYLVNWLNGLETYYRKHIIKHDILTAEVASYLKSLYQSFYGKKIKEYTVRISISQLLSKVALLRAKPALMTLLDLNEIAIDNCKNELSFLLEHFELFISTVTIVEVENTVDEVRKFMLIESLCMRALSFSYLFRTEQVGKEKIKETINHLLNDMQMVKKQLALKIPKANFPNKSSGMGFLDRLLGNLLELCKRERDPSFRDDMEKFQMELESLRSCIRGSSQEGYELLECKDLGARVTKLIYESEYVIDSIQFAIGAQWQHMLWIDNLEREIKSIKMLAATKLQEKTCEDRGQHIPKNPSSITRAGKPETDKLVVQLRDQEEVILGRLTRGCYRRDIVSIVGMPGLGKTTLAKKIYDDPKVSYHFHRRAWCFVSQSYQKRDLLLQLLGDIHGLSDEVHEMGEADLELKLRRCLKGNRYLIVMDDVWDVGAWKDLQTSFPDDGNGSRILITSRLHQVALDAMPGSNPHELRTLSGDESWKLLEMRIFHEEGCCPKELVKVGKEIAEQCKGLPLSVGAVAGMLEKTEKMQGPWQRILNELNAQVIDDLETQCKSIMEMSYNHLPDHLKACLLYFGAFQKDRDVQVGKLIKMWIAEGFIQKTEQKSLEEEGEDSLRDLIDRSLVMVSKRKSTGKVKECRMHDLLRDLCLSKSKEENFLQLITSYDEPYASFHNLYDGVDVDNDDPSKLAKYESYRVCTYLKRKHFVDSRPSGHRTHSLIFIASNDAYPRRPYNLSFICENFKLLRVLDLESINLGISFPIGIEFLVLLRYLALSGDLDSIPESISNLWKLETFIVKGLSGKVVLPDTFWCMTTLRHVHVKNQAAFNLLGDNFGSNILLNNLVTFSSPSLSYGKDTEKILRKLPNLLKLRCIFLESRDSSGNCNPFPTLDFLMHLQSLNILYAGRDRNPCEFNLPLSLRKLTLSRFRLSWNHMSMIGRLPNLEVFKLLSGSLEGLTWDMKEEFCKLKFLKLDSLDIVQWNASSDHLPELEQLVLWNCKDLEDVPCDFSGISTLQIIEVQRCSESLEESIGNIKESMEWLQVLISH